MKLHRQESGLAATRRQILGFARDTNDAATAERAAKVCSIRASTDRAELDAAVALARKGLELDAQGYMLGWTHVALGMALYRRGDDEAAVEAFLAAQKAMSDSPLVTGIAAFYWAMSLFRLGRQDEARRVALAAAAEMKPLPDDEERPLAHDDYSYHDDRILWLPYSVAAILCGWHTRRRKP
ncbi:MAG: hypothetical protein MUF23_03660 [Pirellula sp.]|jgi:tetratricopeptide (TPR) repeat protein|nr:hypothetical protein [Pirellula sp.]